MNYEIHLEKFKTMFNENYYKENVKNALDTNEIPCERYLFVANM